LFGLRSYAPANSTRQPFKSFAGEAATVRGFF
jgi:hypothetical protein